MLKFKNLMVDIETLGNSNSHVAIVSISAVPFNIDLGFILSKKSCFYKTISYFSNCSSGRFLEQKTIDWWKRQDIKAFEEFIRSQNTLKTILQEFVDYCNLRMYPDFKIWSKGPEFDQAILQDALNQFNIKIPWNYYSGMSMRNVISDLIDINEKMHKEFSKFEGQRHNALDDAIHQAQYVINAKHVLNNVQKFV